MLSKILTLSTALLAVSSALPSRRQAEWPFGPFKTSGRDIVNANGEKVVYAGTNWPGHNDAAIPEGLQYQSVETIVSRIKSLGMNMIRLTYAIEMVDDIISGSPNSAIGVSLNNALGSENGSVVLEQILANNPSFTESTTRLEVFDAVAAECHKQQILVHLDNHQSKAEWCCGSGDGQAWFGDTNFPIENWRRGLAFMAEHAKSWPAFVSTALRNELRPPGENSPVADKYGWADWLDQVVPAADGIHQANPDALIFYSGLQFDTDLVNVTRGLPLNGDRAFLIEDFPYADKIVFELHNYNNELQNGNCAAFNMYFQGYNAMDTSPTTIAKNIAPVLLTEFGFPQDDTTYQRPYANCIKEYLTKNIPGGPAGWTSWALGGSYYIRQGIQDYDETWGLFNHDWSDWRSQVTIDNYIKPFVADSLV